MTLKEYMSGTEKAARQMFESLSYYQKLIRDSIPLSFSREGGSKEEFHEEWEKWYQEHISEHNFAKEKANKYLANYMGHASICGSVLQLAHMGISLFSKNILACECLSGKHKKFGVGREVRGLPIGLIIYAGRNQYNHWDEKPKQHTLCIFKKLAEQEVEYKGELLSYTDSSFDIEGDYIELYSHNILGLIGWKNYEDYEIDMLDMLSQYEKEEA